MDHRGQIRRAFTVTGTAIAGISIAGANYFLRRHKQKVRCRDCKRQEGTFCCPGFCGM
jgi:hypothetical protein